MSLPHVCKCRVCGQKAGVFTAAEREERLLQSLRDEKAAYNYLLEEHRISVRERDALEKELKAERELRDPALQQFLDDRNQLRDRYEETLATLKDLVRSWNEYFFRSEEKLDESWTHHLFNLFTDEVKKAYAFLGKR
jgi:hypothetical protein